MKNRFSNLVSTYLEFTNRISSEDLFLQLPVDLIGFWERWVLLHKITLKELDISELSMTIEKDHFDKCIKKFMRKREAMISALLQGTKQNFPKFLSRIGQIIYEHDQSFLAFLKEILSNLDAELTKIQTARKVTIAYNHNQQLFGG